MQGAGYWIDPDGQVKRQPGGRHIDQIIADPARFGFTDTEIRECYAREQEPLGFEGRARVWLIHRALERGLIHIRLDVRRGWLVSLAHLGPEQETALSRWALDARKQRWASEHTPLFIDGKADGTVHQTTVREWLNRSAKRGSPVLPDGKLEEQSC